MRIWPLLLTSVACLGVAAPAAGDTLLSTPPDHFIVSPGGVDMRSGRYVYEHTDLSIGGDNGLSLTRTMAQQVAGHISPFGSFSHNFDMMIVETRVNISGGNFGNLSGNDYQIQVASGGLSQTFRSPSPAGYGFTPTSSGSYGILSYASGDRAAASTVYTYQSDDGSTVIFRPIGSGDCSPSLRCAFVSQLMRADGTTLNFEYDNIGGSNATRLRSITSNRGQALIFEYSGMQVTKACLLNLAAVVKPVNNVCPAGAQATNYSYDTVNNRQRLASVTDPTSAVWRFVNAISSIGFQNPGDSSPWLTNQIELWTDDDGTTYDIVDSQSFADGRGYRYRFDTAPTPVDHVAPIAGGSYWDGQGNQTVIVYGFPKRPGSPGPGQPCNHFPCSPYDIEQDQDLSVYQMTSGPVAIMDPLQRTTTNDYCDQNAKANYPATERNRCLVLAKPQINTDPAGIRTYMTWDLQAGLLLQSREVAKPGSGLSDKTRSATYKCSPSTMRYCRKPLSLTDAKLGKTEYTYAPEHGGVLTELRPAPTAGAARPLKLTTWMQRYAYYLNNSGALARAATPVWVMASETECQTVAGSNATSCDGAVPTRVTTYQYGADGTAGNLSLRGTVIAANGQSRRTCFLYNSAGDRIAQTGARAGLTSCP